MCYYSLRFLLFSNKKCGLSHIHNKIQANSVSNENLLYSTPAYCKKNTPLKKQINRTIENIIKSDNTANTHKQSESTTLTQPNNLHIERASGSHQYTHPSDASWIYELHTLIAKQWISTLNFTHTHKQKQANLHLRSATAFEENTH